MNHSEANRQACRNHSASDSHKGKITNGVLSFGTPDPNYTKVLAKSTITEHCSERKECKDTWVAVVYSDLCDRPAGEIVK